MTEDARITWLRSCITARLEAAKAATPGPWEFEGDDVTDDEVFSVCECGPDDLFAQPVAYTRHRQVENGQHIAANDPQQVIADCEMQLALTLNGSAMTDSRDAEYLLRHLAAAYRHKDGYQEHWGHAGT